MLPPRIASRYANALFTLAQSQHTTDAWERELATLAAVMADVPELADVLTHPEIPLARKREIVRTAFQEKVSDAVLAVLLLLLKRGHEPDMATIHAIFLDLWNQARNMVPVSVTSAVPLSEAQTQALTAVLARRTGATIELQRNVDPELIAGMVVTIGDRMIDASARTTLEQLRESMRGM